MIRIVLVIAQPALRQLLEATLHSSKAALEGFDIRFSDSLGAARDLVARIASALIACILCAVSLERKFYRDEARSLLSAGVFAFLEEAAVTDGDRFIATLRRIAAHLSGARVLAFLQGKLPPATFGAVQTTLATVCDVSNNDLALDSHSRIRRVREQVGRYPPVSAEREDIAARLFLLIDLIETCQRPVAALYGLAAFPTASDACEMLRTYAMVEARELTSVDARNRARARLLQILLGQTLTERRRAPREPENPTPGPPDSLQSPE